MNHKLFLVALLPLGFPVAAAVAEWVTTPLDPRVSLQTPVALQELDLARILRAQGASEAQIAGNAGTRSFLARDPTGSYVVLRREIGGTDLSTAPPAARAAFYDYYLAGVMRSEHGVLLERTAFSVAGLDGVEYRYRGLNKGTKRIVVKYARGLVVDQTCYTLNYVSADPQDSTGTTGTAERLRFFRSITVLPKPIR
jgi:hypothetical protein